ncbi:LysE family translocator [Microbulbifer hydrolyticus]|uniref:LysE family transporter n=1 Tax=Microbulbifer hydrolyticus TaxID=48074 RepID=A0A6P1TC78_9GAMM|nr:LysE family translocator [Microbulbifer hydrolyticus]MBB5210705.1 threonine/homoserine/homoserine lactone efflux protein [Microbulbifer hydrolyticus]QHQ38839.1 LysE family transporter [Microbulbifer hydrolyticus]
MEILLSIALFVFSTSITPGPNNLMIMASGLNHGVGRSLPHLLGICVGFPAMILAIGFGMGALFRQFPFLHEVVRWAGITYLLYLAWKIARTRQVGAAGRAHPFSFLQAVAFQWVNPKGWIMAVGALAAFTTPDGETWMEAGRIALAFILIGGPCITIWMMFGVGLKRLLTQPVHLRIFNVTMGLLLAASVIPMLTTEFG